MLEVQYIICAPVCTREQVSAEEKPHRPTESRHHDRPMQGTNILVNICKELFILYCLPSQHWRVKRNNIRLAVPNLKLPVSLVNVKCSK